jgi:hypothetical protein
LSRYLMSSSCDSKRTVGRHRRSCDGHVSA